MFSNFKKSFKPTKEELKIKQQLLNNLAKEIPTKKNVKLIEVDGLKMSTPFQHFIGDCTCCQNYIKSPYNFVEGGVCKTNNCNCEYGFTCELLDLKNNYK